MHPRYEIPPDNWIPYAPNNDTSSINLPPPHEMSRPVSPVEPSPTQSEAFPLPPPSIGSRETIIPIAPSTPGSRRDAPRIYAPSISVRSRDYAYPTAPSHTRPPTTGIMSPQSRTSTRISEYDIVGRPNFANIYRQPEGDRDSLGSRRHYYRDVRHSLLDSVVSWPLFMFKLADLNHCCRETARDAVGSWT